MHSHMLGSLQRLNPGLCYCHQEKPVTPQSVERLGRRKLRELPARYNAEGDEIPYPWYTRFFHYVGTWFDKESWKDYFAAEGEELVDANLLSWAYLEIGIIESIGTIVTFMVALIGNGISIPDAIKMSKSSNPIYFLSNSPAFTTSAGKSISGHEQAEFLARAQTAAYISIMIQQLFNLFMCKARFRLPFGSHMFRNRRMFAGAAAGTVFGIFIGYTPGVNIAFGSSYQTSPIYWLIPIAFGIFIMVYVSLRILFLRKFRPTKFNPEITGLQMYPTSYSLVRAESKMP